MIPASEESLVYILCWGRQGKPDRMTLGNREQGVKRRDGKEGSREHRTKKNALQQVAGGLGMDFWAQIQLVL